LNSGSITQRVKFSRIEKDRLTLICLIAARLT
jgi:hypothetical protein